MDDEYSSDSSFIGFNPICHGKKPDGLRLGFSETSGAGHKSKGQWRLAPPRPWRGPGALRALQFGLGHDRHPE